MAANEAAALEQRATEAASQMVHDILEAVRKAWPAYFDLFTAQLGALPHQQLAHTMVCALDAALDTCAKPETTEAQLQTYVVDGFTRALAFYREGLAEPDRKVRHGRTGSMLQ